MIEKQKYYDITQVPYARVSKDRILTGISRLDYAIKGIEVGITLVVGNTNAGKSTLIQGFLSKAIEQGYKTWVFSGEHTAESFLQLIYHQNSKPKDYKPIGFKDTNGNSTSIIDWYVTEEQEKIVQSKFADNLFLYSNKAERNIDAMIDSMKDCLKNKGVRFFIIDNLISIDNVSSNVFAEQTIITEKIRTFSLNNNVMVLLVAHQRKNSERGFRIDVSDVAGSLNISNKAYNILALYRTDMINDKNKDYICLLNDLAKNDFALGECGGVIEVLKTKGNGNALIGINYNSETKNYVQGRILKEGEADKIFKIRLKQSSFEDLMPVEDDSELPF